MRLSVRHVTVYRYDAPLRFVAQSHRLTPATWDGQRVADWAIRAEGAVFGASFVDGAGDLVTTMTLHGPVDEIEVRVEGTVETTDTAGVLRGHREIISPRAYLRDSAATHANADLVKLQHEALIGAPEDDDLTRAHRLSAAVSEAIAYRPGTTSAHTTAAEALARGEGVCQDHANAVIALAHASNLPARYVTGYLLTGEADEAAEAAHAWAEIHVGRLGWIGFDAANRCCPDPRYIRLGSGRDALEAAPIRGVSRGVAAEALDVSVTVAQTQQ